MSSMYGPLDESKNEIRLLSLVPYVDAVSSPDEDLIRCKLDIVSLDDISAEYAAYLSTLDPLECSKKAITEGWHHNLSKCSTELVLTSPQQTEENQELRFMWGDYIALSYTWGDQLCRRPIIVNDTEVHVGQNLEQALRVLRNKKKVHSRMKLWVDALCINQLDFDERNRQVKRMRAIYSRAKSVNAWLGVSDDNSDRAIDCLLVMQDVMQHCSGYELVAKIFRESSDVVPRSMWLALFAFLTRSYWSRAWIIQELVLGQENVVFLCGDKEINLQPLSEWALFAFIYIEEFIRLFRGSDPVDWERDPQAVHAIQLIAWLEVLRTKDKAYDHFEPLNDLVALSVNTVSKPSLFFLVCILTLTLNSHATRDVDKIYGVLGLLHPTLRRDVKPDYTMPVENVFIDFSRSLIRNTGYLEFVYFGGRKSPTLPSWVVDWRVDQRNYNLSAVDGKDLLVKTKDIGGLQEDNGENSGTRATVKLCDLSFSEDSRLLHYKGLKVDVIDGCSCRVPPDTLLIDSRLEPPDGGTALASDPKDGANPSILDTTEIITQPVRKTHAYPDQNVLRSSLQELMLCTSSVMKNSGTNILDIPFYKDFMPGDDVLRELHSTGWIDITTSIYYFWFHAYRLANTNFHLWGRGFCDFFTEEMTEAPDPERMITKLHRVSDVMGGRMIVTTERGFLGCAIVEARHGDLVYVFEGCSIPVILRPRGQYFEVIGECFMDSYATAQIGRLVQRREISKEDITLC